MGSSMVIFCLYVWNSLGLHRTRDGGLHCNLCKKEAEGLSIHRSRTRVIYLLIWFGASLSLMAYAQTARIGTGLFIILGGIVIMLLAILGIVFALHEESGKQGSSQKEEAP